jgi:hypothetical protein
VSEQKKRLLDREALKNHFGADTLQPFMRESVAIFGVVDLASSLAF